MMSNNNNNMLETAQIQMLLCEDWTIEPMEKNRARENIKRRENDLLYGSDWNVFKAMHHWASIQS